LNNSLSVHLNREEALSFLELNYKLITSGLHHHWSRELIYSRIC